MATKKVQFNPWDIIPEVKKEVSIREQLKNLEEKQKEQWAKLLELQELIKEIREAII